MNGTLARLEALVRDGDEANLAAQTVELISARRAAVLPVDDLTS